MAAASDNVRHVLVEVRHSPAVFASALTTDGKDASPLKKDLLSGLPGCSLDTDFGAVEIPDLEAAEDRNFPMSPFDLSEGRRISLDHEANPYLLRATVLEKELDHFQEAARSDKKIIDVFSDPLIEEAETAAPTESEILESLAQICPASPPLGDDRHVAARIGVPWLRRRRMDGHGVFMAIVDSGINLRHLYSRGKRPILDPARSWMARPGDRPGRLPVGHGTMVAYDTLIAAPRATLLDIALLRSTRRGGSVMSGLLSDAVRAYVHLYRVMTARRRPGAMTSLVVNNSWGMFHDSWDFPLGHPGRYQDNPRHPFNRIVGVLAHAGADILFAAGNCGRECPDRRCRGVTNAGIFGANSHPQVTTVVGVDVLKRRVGYSTSGPGRLSYLKPDVAGYTHFKGSGVYPADGGTSAATPVVAGLVAALRSRFPYNPADFRTSPMAIRNLLMRTAEDRGSVGFDFDYGWGIANGRRIAMLRSLSVMSTAEEAAASIDEVTGVERLLESIEGLDQLEREPEDIEALPEEEFEEMLLDDELAVEPPIAVVESSVAADRTGEELPVTAGAEASHGVGSRKKRPVGEESGAELH